MSTTDHSRSRRSTRVKKLDGIADLYWTQHQLHRIGRGKDPDPTYGTVRALLSAMRSNGVNTLRRRRL